MVRILNGFFVFDKETGIGFTVSDEEIRDASVVIGGLVGAYAVYSMVVLLLALVIAAPFLGVFAVDYFFATIVEGNTAFFVGVGLLLILTRLFWGRGSQNWAVRILSFLYIFTLVLYVLLKVMRMDAGVYTFFGLFERFLPESALAQLFAQEELGAQVDGNWFYEVFLWITDKFISYVKWIGLQVFEMDHSAYMTDLADINILQVLKTVLLDIAVGGFALVTVLAGALALVAILVIGIILPYLAAFFATVTVNKGIYAFRSLQTRKTYEHGEEMAKDPTLQAALRKAEIHSAMAQKEAAALYLQAAKGGNIYAMHLYADCLDGGKGVFADSAEAFRWYQKAAKQGMCNSMYMIATYFCYGNGTYVDRTLARAWMMSALRHEKFLNFVRATPKLEENMKAVLRKCRFAPYF